MYNTNEPEYLVWLPMTKVQAECMCLLHPLQGALVHSYIYIYIVGFITLFPAGCSARTGHCV